MTARSGMVASGGGVNVMTTGYGTVVHVSSPAYRERLYPPVWIFIVGIIGGASLGLAYGAAYGAVAGWLVAASAVFILMAWLATTTVAISVTDDGLSVGRATLPWTALGSTAALDKNETVAIRGVNADPRAFVVMRSWCSSTMVTVEVRDPRDPHPYWLVTSRHPDRLARSIEESRPR